MLSQFHRDHVNAQMLADGKMSIVTGNWGDELDVLTGPGLLSGNAVNESEHRQIMHDRQTGIVGSNDVVDVDAQQLTENTANLRETSVTAVVTNVAAVLGMRRDVNRQ